MVNKFCLSRFLIKPKITTIILENKKKSEKIRKISDGDKAASLSIITASSKLNSKIGIWLGDITTLEIDAIVNAANKTLLGKKHKK